VSSCEIVRNRSLKNTERMRPWTSAMSSFSSAIGGMPRAPRSGPTARMAAGSAARGW
jgi:hypothetical protein